MAQTDRQIAMYEGLSTGQFRTKYRVVSGKPKMGKCERPNCRKKAKAALDGHNYCWHCFKKQKKKSSRRARSANKLKNKDTVIIEKDWKKRVFASWKDTPEQAAIRRSPEYQEWRKVVLERDNYTCQHCEKTGGKLVVHHIKTFKMHSDLRLDPDNGIVLCNNCHESLHLNRMKKPKILRYA